ncbi:MAG: TonB-dependent receptor [Bacteroidales bacterium]
MRIPKGAGIITLIVLLISYSFSSVYGQGKTRFDISGSVSEMVSNEKIPYAVVLLPALNVWAVTDDNGVFVIKDIPPGEWLIEVSCLGYQKKERKIAVNEKTATLKLKMHPMDLTLKDVVVTAEAGTNINSSSKIGRTAIQHLQAASLSDVLQLLPGQITANPDLSKPGVLTIRETNTGNDVNALGTSLVVDGARISNDANLQSVSTTKDDSSFPAAAGTGIDTRKITPDRIESVEVIRGVASAEYGDLTSGAVIMTTKAGITPYEVSLKTDPRLKSASFGKGVSLGANKGFMNVDADYTHAFRDIRTSSDSYNRMSGQLGYSNRFNLSNSKLSFNAKASGYITLNTVKNDPDKSLNEYLKSKDNQIDLNLFGNWLFNKSWITCIRYTFFGSYGYQRTEENKEFQGTNPVPVTYTTQNGEQLAMFLPINYTQLRVVEGKPVYLQGKVSANACHKTGAVFNRAFIGAEWSSIGNNGKGKWGEYMPQGYRDRSFSDIPYIHNYSFFVEDRMNVDLDESSLELQAGVRMTNVLTDAASYTLSFDPRFNAKYAIIERPAAEIMRLLSIRAGWGIQHKMPTLMHLYPDPFYEDHLSFSYQNSDFTEGMAIMTSKVVDDTSNPDLKLPQSTNFEVGTDWNIAGIKGSVVYFNEKLKNAFTFDSYLATLPYNIYNRTSSLPEYKNGILMENGVAVPFTQDTVFAGYKRPGNQAKVDKWGIEYTVNFGKIPALHTSIIVDGAYMNIRRTDIGEEALYKKTTINQQNRKYAAIYEGRATGYCGIKSERLNTNVRFVTNIPKIRMVVSLGVQCVWLDRSQWIASNNGNQRIIMRDAQGNRVEGDVYKDAVHTKYLYPIALVDFDGNRVPFTEEMMNNAHAKDYEVRMNPTAFLNDDPNPYFMLNLRLTKEFGNIARFSFYANNFTNSNPKRYYRASGLYRRVNSDIYCGAELNFSF